MSGTGLEQERALEQKIGAFRKQAEEATLRLAGLQEKIRQGQAPDETEVADCARMLTGISARYAEVTGEADALLAEDERPEPGASVDAYLQALKQRAEAELAKALREAERTLEAFLSIRSDTEVYETELRPFQEKAAERLAAVRAEEEKRARSGDGAGDCAVPDVSGEALLCDAAGRADTDSEAFYPLLEEINRLYGFRIAHGISSHKYRLAEGAGSPDGETSKQSREPDAAQEKEPAGEPRKEAAPAEVTPLPEQRESAKKRRRTGSRKEKKAGEAPGRQEESREQTAQTGAGTAPAKSAPAEATSAKAAPAKTASDKTEDKPLEKETEEVSAAPEAAADAAVEHAAATPFEALAVRRGALLPEDYAFPVLTGEENPAGSKKVSGAIFAREILRAPQGLFMCFTFIARDIVDTGATSIPLLAARGAQDGLAEKAVDWMVRKGYLAKFALQPGGEYYRATKRLIRALESRQGAGLLGTAQIQPGEDAPQPGEDSPAAAMAACCRMDLERRETACDIGLGILKQHTTQGILPEAFVLSMSSEEGKEASLFAGEFWTDLSGLESFREFLSEVLKKQAGPFRRVIFASGGLQEAAGFAAAVLETAEIPVKKEDIWLYVFPEGSCYAYPGDAEVEDAETGTEGFRKVNPEEIWREPEAAAPDDPDAAEAREAKEKKTKKEKKETAGTPGGETAAEGGMAGEAPAPKKKAAGKKRTPAGKKAGAQKNAAKEDEEEKEKTEAAQPEEPAEPAETVLPQEAVHAHEAAKEHAFTDPVAPGGRAGEEETEEAEEALQEPAPLDTVDPEKYRADMAEICRMTAEGKAPCAVAYAHALSLKYRAYVPVYDRLAYAFHAPERGCYYSSDNAFNLIPDHPGPFEQALMAAAALRTFFSNQKPYDFGAESLYNSVKDYPVISGNAGFTKVIYALMEFKKNEKKGMDAYAGYHARSKDDIEQRILALQKEAAEFYKKNISEPPSEQAKMRRFVKMKKMLFQEDGDLPECIRIVKDSEEESLPVAETFLRDNFYQPETEIRPDTADRDRIWDYIRTYWDRAGREMTFQKRADLMSSLRSNIVSIVTRAVQLIAAWCVCIREKQESPEDHGMETYRRIRAGLLSNINIAQAGFRIREGGELSPEEKAAAAVLSQCVDELKRCIEGTYDEREKQYFYVPLLKSDRIILTEEYLPDLDVHTSRIASLQPEERILHFSGIPAEDLPSWEERLRAILEGGDDFGSARLIVRYLKEKNPGKDYPEEEQNIEGSEKYVKRDAAKSLDDFTGELELAESYGQFTNIGSAQDRKDRILHAVDEWYAWAQQNSNYGFFRLVTQEYLQAIKEEARARDEDLENQLLVFEQSDSPQISLEEKERRIRRIREAIAQQNYTAAEDLLSRAGSPEDEILPPQEDFLREFLADYDGYYRQVPFSGTNFNSFLLKKTQNSHNRDQRGARKLAENWMNSAGRTTAENLGGLLAALGFRIGPDSVGEIVPKEKSGPLDRFQSFVVRTERQTGGSRENYTHPIAAFGSGAAREGFRVILISGHYAPDQLIDLLKPLFKSKHTLVLYDAAMTIAERRLLARLMKKTSGEKLFIFLDRVALLYLIRHYDGTKMNRMLMAVTVPFGYYEPYISGASTVMPPEMFIGRRMELEKIESPTGVNIVYGGRQLGKSALLRKAYDDINLDENGDRAVVVDIKGLDYRQAAVRVGQELCDQGILHEDPEAEDWSTLARALRRRLLEKEGYIPYFLLLLDEADRFIESAAAADYQPFDALKDVQTVGEGRFKFVIAGLRNVVRFHRDAALGNNSVLTQLGSLTVKPFTPSEARELLEMPLHYLGLEFPREKEYLVTLILATTNYFPGLIQLYGQKLLEAMRKPDYAGYSEADSPIYEISEEHIKKILTDREFQEQIREKFFVTLRLDEDNYYYLIALLLADLCYERGYGAGYSAADIQKAGEDLAIGRVASMSAAKISAYMEEMRELGILRNTDQKRFLFTRTTFFQMMGDREEVEDQLAENMEE